MRGHGHDVQLRDPGEEEYVPIGQMEQVDEFVAPVALDAVPAGQSVQAVDLFAPGVPDQVPAGQDWHLAVLVAPIAAEKVPMHIHTYQGESVQTNE